MGKIAGGASVDMAPKMPVVTAFTFSTPNRTSVVEIAVARVVVTVVFALAWVAVSVTFPGTDVKDGGGFVVCPLVSNVVLIDYKASTKPFQVEATMSYRLDYRGESRLPNRLDNAWPSRCCSNRG